MGPAASMQGIYYVYKGSKCRPIGEIEDLGFRVWTLEFGA